MWNNTLALKKSQYILEYFFKITDDMKFRERVFDSKETPMRQFLGSDLQLCRPWIAFVTQRYENEEDDIFLYLVLYRCSG